MAAWPGNGTQAIQRQPIPLVRRAVPRPTNGPSTPGRRRPFVVFAVLGLASVVGASIPLLGPGVALPGFVAILVVVAVAFHPPLAAYGLIALTPLVAGIDRDTLIPVLRPNEALALLLAAGLVVRAVVRLRAGRLPRISVGPVDVSILLMAVAGSVLPLAWRLVRGQPIEQDDLLYALMIWKYYGVYLIVRSSVRTERQVRACLWIAMAAASIVAVIAVVDSLQLFGVRRALSRYYTPYGNAHSLADSRGGATLSLPVAVADLMTFNLAIAVGFLIRARSHRALLWAMGVAFVAGALASGQFSAAIALLIGVLTMAVVTRRVRPLLAFLPALVAAGFALRPVIEQRLSGFQSVSGIPVSWSGRLYNLTSYFWPQLFSHWNFVLGVRPAARVATARMSTGYIWIESGYTWLLWSGGIPLLAAFAYFLWKNLRRGIVVARSGDGPVGVAALALVVGLVEVGVLMIVDPHLTYRGSADLLFSLLALTCVASVARPSIPEGSGGVVPLHVGNGQDRPEPGNGHAGRGPRRAPGRADRPGPSDDGRPLPATPRSPGTLARPRRGAHRILIVIENVPLSHDHRAKKQVESLLDAGYEVSVISRQHEDNDALRHREGLRLLEYPAPRESRGKISYVAEYSYSWLAAARLAVRAFREDRFAVIQAGHPPDIYFPLALPFKMAGRRFVVDQRDLSPELYRARYGAGGGGIASVLETLERLSWRSADHVFCVNESLRHAIVQRGGVAPEVVTVVGNGPVLARTARRPPRPELKGGKRFLACWVGLMGPQDRVDLAVRAVHHVVHTLGRRDCHFSFVGEGEVLGGLRRLARRLDVDEWVTFTGWLDEEGCFEYLSTADIGLDSSLQEEVTPVKGMEYMAFGVPFASFDLKEVRAMAGDAAVYAKAGDPLDLARVVVDLLDDPGRRTEMRRVAGRRIDETLAWDRQKDRYLNVYRALLEPDARREPLGPRPLPAG